jgi:hypothetical protein
MDGAAQELVIDRTSLQLPPVSLAVQLLIVVVGVASVVWRQGVAARLALHPVAFLPPNFQLWVPVTYVFVDLDIINLVISIVSFPVFAKVLENLYGSRAFGKYLGVVVVTTGIVLLLLGVVEPLFLSNLSKWTTPQTAFYGFQPGLMACFVALKQAMPDTFVSIFFLFKVRLGMLPVFALTLTTLAGIFLPSRGVLAMWVSLPIAWGYLRFFSTLYSQSVAGDLRESFSLASFFPAALQPYALPVSRWIDARRFWPARAVASALPVVGGAELDSRVAQVAGLPQPSSSVRENRAIATELINERLESIERQSPIKFDGSIAFGADDSFVEVTPIKPTKK